MQFSQMRIQVFCKAPQAGKVKTRLAKTIGESAAAKVHQYLAWHALKQIAQFSLARVELWCAPDCDDDFFRRCQEAFSIPLKKQIGDDLGQRMKFAINDALADDCAAIVVGTDCPVFSREYLMMAIEIANTGKTVVGPAEDGGYVLLGVNKRQPDIFTDMPWGTPAVLEETLHRLGEGVKVLPMLWDIDHAEDLLRLREAGSGLAIDEEFTAYLNKLKI